MYAKDRQIAENRAEIEWTLRFRQCRSLKEKITAIDEARDHLYCANPAKFGVFSAIVNFIDNDESLKQMYIIDPTQTFWGDRIKIIRHMDDAPESIVLRPTNFQSALPIAYDTENQDYTGLYFIGATYFVPTTMEAIYAVKIGIARRQFIGSRLRQYGTANPFIYHEREHTLPFYCCPEANERVCHDFLENLAIRRFEKDSEWYIVDRDTYFFLCENLKDKAFFANIATGKVRTI